MKQKGNEILEKHRTLESVRAQLKSEFIGIDSIIDRVIDVATPWFLFPAMQDRPLVINLWGLTGVGKTSLVSRFVKLIGFENRYFKFDLGEAYDKDHSIKRGLQNLYPHHNAMPLIIAFDEFQLARTINASDDEIDKGFIRNVWDILDNGKLVTTLNTYAQTSVYQLIHLLVTALGGGAVIQKGMVTEGHEFYMEVMKKFQHAYIPRENEEKQNGKKNIKALPSWSLEEILEISLGKFNTIYDLEKHINTLDCLELVKFLHDIYKDSLGQQIMDCSKGLVFVMGNLDEAFPMSHDLNLDISPDDFHRQSLEININTIRAALTRRFRPEQIARLGSCHLIYPAFSSDSFRKLISAELKKISARAAEEGVTIDFDASIHELIFSEGVFPTQGVRPLYTTIHELIGSQVGKIMVERFKLGKDLNKVEISRTGTRLEKTFRSNKGRIVTIAQELDLSVHKLRKPRRDELQTVTAVHEAGHVVISIGLLNSVPVSVHSVTSANNVAGFTRNENPDRCMSHRELKLRLVALMGGLAAEEIIFGKEHVTLGSGSDLRKATRLVNEMLLESGMGEVPGFFEAPMNPPNASLPPTENQRTIAETWLREAHETAKAYLNTQRNWLLQLAGYLSEHPVIESAALREMAVRFGASIDTEALKENPQNNFYRSKLKAALSVVQEGSGTVPKMETEIKAA